MTGKKKQSDSKRSTNDLSDHAQSPKSKGRKSSTGNSSIASNPINPPPGTQDIVNPSPLLVVGLGASAGGLEALEEFFRAMPADSGLAFVVVVHQAANHVSLMPELLDRCTTMDVATIVEGMGIEPNRVYIAPPGKNVDVLDRRFHLVDIGPRHVAPLPIDYFFRSLAQAEREQAVGIILSGTGTDGSTGLAAIKGEFGLAIVQTVESAKFTGMPQNAIASNVADYVLAPSEMPRRLMAYTSSEFLKPLKIRDVPNPDILPVLPEILLLLRRRCRHDFSKYKPTTICRRIERRMNIHQITSPKQYLKYLEESASEPETLFKELLIGVTSFFRDPWAFEALANQAVLPILRDRLGESSIRIWVPGCATGEEAYTIAILFRECMDQLNVSWRVQIFATDLDSRSIQHARMGLFSSGIASDVSAARLNRFFVKENDCYRIRKELRDWIVFAEQNVIHDPPFTKLDLLSCRNLLIYMQPELQLKLLNIFHYSLKPTGYLFLGTSESLGEMSAEFDSLDSKAKLFQRKLTSNKIARVGEQPFRHASIVEHAERPAKSMKKNPPTVTVRQSVAELLANNFAPPTVIVNSAGDIVHVHGRTGQFLELTSGGPPKNILSMAREGLELDLAAALRSAAAQDDPVVFENVPIKVNDATILTLLTVQRISEPESIAGLLRVSFQTTANTVLSNTNTTSEKSPAKKSRRDVELEKEIQNTRQSLQRMIEELDASNEEMTSSNEELQSTNEELQSTNEELETSKEELQSLNEELETINSEFQNKIRELSQANDDMRNLLNSTEIATIFLDNRLCIKSYTEQAKRIIRLIPSDVGRPLQDLTSHLEGQHVVSLAEEVLRTLAFKECEVQTDDGRWLLLRILPYRTSNEKIDGLVMTFIDINELKRTQSAIQHAKTYAENIVETIREPLLILDDQLRVQSANRAFYKKFQTTQEKTINQLLYDLANGQLDIPQLRESLNSILLNNSTFDDFLVEPSFPKTGAMRMLLNGRCISATEKDRRLILLAIEEVGK